LPEEENEEKKEVKEKKPKDTPAPPEPAVSVEPPKIVPEEKPTAKAPKPAIVKKVPPPKPESIPKEVAQPKPKEVPKETPAPKPEGKPKEVAPPKPEVKVEEIKTKEPQKPQKEAPSVIGKDHKTGEKTPGDPEKVPKEKKGGEKVVEGKPKKEPKDEKSEFLTRLSPLIFGKYDLSQVVVEDPGLRRYINLQPIGLPHSGARHANKSFGKTKVNIVERLINNMMRTEHSTGKKSFMYKTVNRSFEIIAKRTKTNPVQVLINAIQNSSPKEEITRLRFGGISVPKAVDTSAAHRLDVALRNICKGAVSSSHKNKKRMAMCLAEEIILASKADMNSFAVSKKEEMERIAASAR
jgi:small subunit ribosomal protein S7